MLKVLKTKWTALAEDESGVAFAFTVTVALIVPGRLNWALLPAALGCVAAGAFLGSIRRSGTQIRDLQSGKYR